MMTDRIGEIAQSLERARTAVREGATLDLAGLYAAVEAAMAEVATAPICERAALVAALGQLLHTLEGLAADLLKQQRSDTQRRAAAAYGAAHGARESER
ncbi:MAG TPA: hypothetical protein VLV50_16170 [Stellaceae bacterium]|nr:hypothetical protein [Stellaceae bacterium]